MAVTLLDLQGGSGCWKEIQNWFFLLFGLVFFFWHFNFVLEVKGL